MFFKEKKNKIKRDRTPKPQGPVMTFINKYSLILHIPLAMFLCWFIEMLSRHSAGDAFGFIVQHPGPFLYNSFFIYVILSLTYVTARFTFNRLLIILLISIFGLINSIILANRVSPFGFNDINMLGDLFSMSNSKYLSTQQVVGLLIGIGILAFLLERLHKLGRRQKTYHKSWHRWIAIAVCWISLIPVTKICQQTDVLDTYFGNLANGYLDNGYLYGFVMSMVGRGMNQPDNYNKATIDKILEDTSKGDSTISQKDEPNVIVVLLESFFDPYETDFLEMSEDPIPYVHSLEKNYSTGHLTVPVVGAGTCNTEFEVLTGMSCHFFGPGEYPQKTILKKTDCESVADVLKKLGYGAHVVHNNGGNFYSRANAFSRMGFDTFTCKEVLDITDYTPLGSWPTDDILVGAAKDALDSTDSRDFEYIITVGTHGNYPDYQVIDDPKITVTAKGKDEGTKWKWEYYVNMLNNMDRFVEELTDMLSKRDEPTLLIMFGDHLPTMGLTEDEVSQHDLYQTKYITWNNFGMAKQDQDLTSYQLVSEYLDRLGIHGGTIVDYNQTMTEKQVNPESDEYLDNLELLQYDLLYGKKYAYDGVDMYPASDLTIGINDVIIKKAYSYNGRLHIYGENFTKWSKVYINGDKVNTKYESGQVLSIDADQVTDGDTIVVNQLGSNNTIFRSSNEFVYHMK